jgi:4-hydroxyphenylacetate 3-monooxygenase
VSRLLRASNSSAGRASKRVFLLGDVELCNNWGTATNRNLHTGQQVVTKQVVKAEFRLDLASLMVQTLGSGQVPHVQQMPAEIIENLREPMTHWVREFLEQE